MAESGDYRLKPGTVLDERYLVQEVIGEGGFGITYRALHRRVNRQVAIKEFFLRDQNYRDTDVSSVLQVTRREQREYFEREKENFVKEAQILGEFSGEKHMVSVLDYFEENGTAYMVMELLEGETLKEYLELHGRMDPKETFEKFLPVMELLEKLHRRNIIHRDISPENLMRMPDGSLKLLDFGAARDYDPNLENTYSIIVKKGYAPPEQYRKGAKQGPWTDVYALTAAIYTCITGQAPQDALSRILHDETMLPSELGIPIGQEAENILERGMRLDWEQRYPSMEEMCSAVWEFCGRTAEREKETPPAKKKRWILPCVILTVCACVLAAAAGYYFRSDKKQQMFRDTETETFVVCPSKDMTLSEFQKVREILTHRLELLAGDSQVLMEDMEDGTIRITVPLQAFGNVIGIEDALPQYILGSIDLRADSYILEAEKWKVEAEDFVDIEVCDGVRPGDEEEDEEAWYLKLTFTEEAGAMLEKQVDDTGEMMLYQGAFLQEYSYSLRPAGDGCTFYLQGEGEKEPYAQLLAYNLTSPRYESSLSYIYDIPAVWEEPDQITTAGVLQCARKELEGEIYCARYGDAMSGDYSEDFSSGERSDIISSLKKRLDAVGISYAFGVSYADEDDFVIAVERDALCLEIMEFLGRSAYDISIGNQWEVCTVFPYGITGIRLQEKEGVFEILVDEDNKEALEKDLESSRKEGITIWYLYLDHKPLAMCDIREDADGEHLVFRQLCSYHEPMISEENSGILRLVKAVWETEGYFSICTQEASQYSDAEGNLQMLGKSEMTEYSLRLMQDRLEEMQRAAEELAPGIQLEILGDPFSYPELSMTIPMEFGENFAREYLELFQKIYEACDMGRGDFGGVLVYWDEEQSELGERARLCLSRNSKKRLMNCYGIFCGGRLEAYKEEAEAYVSASDFYQGLKAENDEWRFEL